MNNSKLSLDILSDITTHMKYAKYVPELQRRETFNEICDRNKEMHIKKYPQLKMEIEEVYENFVKTKKVLPSMRSMQFAGLPIERSPVRIYNCSFLPVDNLLAFSETIFLLLSGVGVGYSVQNHHIEKLPEIRKPNPKKTKRFLIGDSIEGWSDSIKVLMKSYFNSGSTINFDYGDIRPKGARLITAGGKAPGPDPLKECHLKITHILNQKEDGDQLTSLEVHDILCHLADAVLAGGIRRAAMISLFDADDMDMISCKSGNWWELNPQRGRANNSAVLLRNKITKDYFMSLWERIENSRAGEPGIFFTNDKDWGTNPCVEVGLRSFQFCNLCEVNVSNIKSQEDLNERVKVASFLGTLQAGYTDFHYLRPIWKKTTEKEALIGVGLTGIGSGEYKKCDLSQSAEIVKLENERVAELIGINKAARTAVVKPSGTASLVLGTSSGVHAWHNDYYIRRIRVNKNEAIYTYLLINHPELVKDEYFSPHKTAVIEIPVKAPDNAIYRTESPIETLERVKEIHSNWINPGHRKGQNTNNVSATISIKDNEWKEVGEWMWKNRKSYTGISVLPYDGGTYIQAPFEDITKEQYEELVKSLHSIDLTKVIEMSDETDLANELACSGGACEIQ
jgi:ribonucleoside-triphosphate reductase